MERKKSFETACGIKGSREGNRPSHQHHYTCSTTKVSYLYTPEMSRIDMRVLLSHYNLYKWPFALALPLYWPVYASVFKWGLYFTAFLVILMNWVWVIVRLWAVFCWTEAGRQAGKPICTVFSLTACGCTVSEGKRRRESCCKREKRGGKTIQKIL